MDYDEIFWEKVLRTHFDDASIRVLEIDEEPATVKGENFHSDIYRVRVEFTRYSGPSEDVEGRRIRETRSFILKLEPTGNPNIFKMVQNRMLFTVELRILRNVLPQIESILGIRLGPKFVHGNDESPRAIITEDLKPQGFRPVRNRQQGLSMAHATMAIKNLAKFHAGSVAILEENPGALKSYRQAIFNGRTHPNMYVLLANSLNRLCEAATTWSDEGSELAAKKLRNVVSSIKDRVQNVYEYDPNEFCVLNHGDVWINNMLFTEDESGRPLEQLFVDYQLVSFSSPAVDLLYFLGVNPAFELRGHGEEVLLEIYLDTLTDSMKNLRCKTVPLTMMHLKEAMYRRRVYAVASGLFFLPRAMLAQEDIEGIDQLLECGTSRMNAYGKPNTIRMMKRLLPLMNDRGYLDP